MTSNPSENTGVIRMMRDYASFLRSPIRSNYLSETLPKLQFSLDASDFITSPDSSFNTVSKLKRKLLEKEAEVQHGQATISHLKSSLQSSEPNTKRLCVELEKELELCKKQCEIKTEQIIGLQKQLQLQKNEESELRSELSNCKQQMDTDSTNCDAKIKTLQQKCQKLQLDIEEAKSSERKIAQDLTAEIKRLQAELKLNKRDSEQSKDQIQLLSKKVQEQTNIIQENENFKILYQKLQQTVKELENKIASMEDTNMIIRAKEMELKLLPELKKDNSRYKEDNKVLRERCKNNLLLQEQLQSSQNRLELLQERNKSLLKLEQEHEIVKQKLNEWESLATDETDLSKHSPSQFFKRLVLMQKDEAILRNKIGELNSNIRVHEATNQKLINKINSLTLELQNEKKREIEYRKLQKRLLLISKERESNKRVISSYEAGNIPSAQSERIRSLESVVESYRNTIDQLEMQYKELQKQSKENQSSTSKEMKETEDSKEVKKLRELVSSQKTNLQLLEKDNQNLQEKLNEAKTSQQAVSSTGDCRILHFKHNPKQIALEQKFSELKQLKEENERLRARVKILEEAGSGAHDITMKVEQHLQEQNPATIESLKKELESAKACNERIMEACRKTSKEFREICYILTGYRIDLSTKNKYKLFHLYAESPDDYLMFERQPNGIVSLLETPYSIRITDKIDLYLIQHDSIPAFLSSLTMDLFNHQTFILTGT